MVLETRLTASRPRRERLRLSNALFNNDSAVAVNFRDDLKFSVELNLSSSRARAFSTISLNSDDDLTAVFCRYDSCFGSIETTISIRSNKGPDILFQYRLKTSWEHTH